MALTPKFYLKDSTSFSKTAIQLRTYINGKLFRYGIGYSIYPDLWDKDKQRPKKGIKKNISRFLKDEPQIKIDLENIDNRISNLISDLKKEIQNFEINNDIIDFNILKTNLDNHYRETKEVESTIVAHTLNDFITHYIKGIENGSITFTTSSGIVRKYQRSTIKVYKEWKTQFELFQKTKKRKYDFENITIDFYNTYVNYFIKKGYKTNAIGKQIKLLKAIMNASYEHGLHKNLDFKKKAFKTLKEDVHSIYLTELEVNRIYNLDLKSDKTLEIVRDVFLCGCYTALRYSDYSRIKDTHIVKRQGIECIEMNTRKTGERVLIPIRHELKSILHKYNNNLPKTYEQKVNDNIKTICKMAEINEMVNQESTKGALKVSKQIPKYNLVQTHTARRTGATLMYKANIPTIDIMKITGHKKESSLLKYIKVTKEETALRLASSYFFRKNDKLINVK